jgi:hypothetical protein
MSLWVYLSVNAPENPDARDDGTLYVYDRNITHNLTRMADALGVYKCIWRPDEIAITSASELVEPLTRALCEIVVSPADYRRYEPSNKWGTVKGFTKFLADYLSACLDYPHASIEVSR